MHFAVIILRWNSQAAYQLPAVEGN